MITIGAQPDPAKYRNLPEQSPHLKDPAARRLLAGRRGSPNVCEGTFVCRRLHINSQYKEIPEYSSAITSMTVSPDGVVYGATSGDRAHVFLYDQRPPFDAVLPLGEIPGEKAIRNSLVWEKDGSVICGTSAGDEPVEGWKGGALYRVTCRNYRVDGVQEWPRFVGQFEPLGVPVPGEGIAALAIDHARRRVYGLSDKTGILFALNLESGKVKRYGSVDPTWHFSHQLMITPSGQILTTAVGGRVVRFDPEHDRIDFLDANVPTYPGRGFYSRINSWVYEPLSGLLYIGDQEDGFLYTLDPVTLETVLLGKPSDRIGIRALAAVPDGRVFGMAGRAGDIGQFFVFEPRTRSLRNLGVPLSAIVERRYGYEFTSAVTGPQGQIFLGESERQSRLFIYFPSSLPPEPVVVQDR